MSTDPIPRSAGRFVALAAAAIASIACETYAPAEALVKNDFADAPAAFVLTRVWYRTTLWTEPVPPGSESQTLRVGTGTERAYAIASVASRSFVLVSRGAITTDVGETRTITFSPSESAATCFTEAQLSREDYEFVISRIFPGERVEPFDGSCPP